MLRDQLATYGFLEWTRENHAAAHSINPSVQALLVSATERNKVVLVLLNTVAQVGLRTLNRLETVDLRLCTCVMPMKVICLKQLP